ncbi:MAG: cell wall-active antibiotics response protein [Burkholderiaceae bacterium]|nr:cell wall-active antibiotics response protein [Burkholderiaceae bacterium]
MVVGLGVIAVGVLFLLDNLGIVEFDYALQLWPVIFILAGVLKFMQSTSSGGRAVGCTLVAVGAVLLLKGMGLIDVTWRVLAPLLMIAAGLMVVFKSAGERKQAAGGMLDKDAGQDTFVRLTALLGGIERRVSTQDFRGGDITAIMGGCQLDLRQASIQGDAVLNVFTMWGGIEIKVPDDWTVSLEGTPLLGGFSERTGAPRDNSKRLIIRGVALMGGVEVRN